MSGKDKCANFKRKKKINIKREEANSFDHSMQNAFKILNEMNVSENHI